MLHVYAYVAVGDSTDNTCSSYQENERRSLVTRTDVEDDDWRKAFRLQPGERRGWWSNHSKPAGETGIALGHGAVCNHRASILLDSGSDTSILSLDLARRLGLKLSFDERLKVKGIGGVTTYVTARTNAKLTLGTSVVYFADLWCGNIGKGIQCLLGMDFMVRAGVRLSAYDGAVRLPDEETVPLVSAGPRPLLPKRVSVASAEDLYVAPGMSARVPVVYGKNADLVVWLSRRRLADDVDLRRPKPAVGCACRERRERAGGDQRQVGRGSFVRTRPSSPEQ